MGAKLTPPPPAAARRARLAARIKNGVVFLFAAKAQRRGRDVFYPYQQDPYFYYLTGCDEAQTAWLMRAQNGRVVADILFCPPANAKAEQWDGARLRPLAARRRLGFAAADFIENFDSALRQHAAACADIYCLPGGNDATDERIASLARARRANNRAGASGAARFVDLAVLVDEARMRKDADEIAAMRRACSLTCAGVMAGMRAAPRAKNECEVAAAISSVFESGGGRHAFLPIVAGGKNALTLHYNANNAKLQKNRLLLTDCGAQQVGYCGDITRCFPVNGVWREADLEIYRAVLAAQRRALAAARAGVLWQAVERAAERALQKELRALGLCRGGARAAAQKTRVLYPHRVGHSLGLDVHDVGNMADADGKGRRLVAGMVMTVEPGVYVPNSEAFPARWRGIGVRIEDDILITKNGNEVLTAAAAKTPREICKWMRG